MMSVGLAVPEGVPVAVGVPLALPLAFGVAAALACVLATAALPLPAFEPLCSWLLVHPLIPEQTSNVKAKAVCRWRLVGGFFIVFPYASSALINQI
jgi:hypothetical protein